MRSQIAFLSATLCARSRSIQKRSTEYMVPSIAPQRCCGAFRIFNASFPVSLRLILFKVRTQPTRLVEPLDSSTEQHDYFARPGMLACSLVESRSKAVNKTVIQHVGDTPLSQAMCAYVFLHNLPYIGS